MNSKMTVEVEGVASALLVRPDVARAEWLAYPLVAIAWEMIHRRVAPGDTRELLATADTDANATVLVDQLADFDTWRVRGGLAFRW